jgi:hypothetical protein
VWDASSIVAGRLYIRSELFKSWSLLLERGPLFVIAAGRFYIRSELFKLWTLLLERGLFVIAAVWFFLLVGRFLHRIPRLCVPLLCAAWEVNTW